MKRSALPLVCGDKDECGGVSIPSETNLTKAIGAITAAIVGEQARRDARRAKKVNGLLEKGDGGMGLLIGRSE